MSRLAILFLCLDVKIMAILFSSLDAKIMAISCSPVLTRLTFGGHLCKLLIDLLPFEIFWQLYLVAKLLENFLLELFGISTLYAPIRTAADHKFCNIFCNLQ